MGVPYGKKHNLVNLTDAEKMWGKLWSEWGESLRDTVALWLLHCLLKLLAALSKFFFKNFNTCDNPSADARLALTIC